MSDFVSPPGYAAGVKSSKQLLKTADPNFQAREIAALTGLEQSGLSAMQRFVSGLDFRDPNQSQAWEGVRQQLDTAEGRGIDAMRRRQQLSGMYSSSPALREEGQFRADMGGQRASILGGLLQNELARNSAFNRGQAGIAMGGLQRAQDQQVMDAQYEAAMQQMMFPWTTREKVAQGLRGLSGGPSYLQSAPQSGVGDYMQAATSLASMYRGGGGTGSGGYGYGSGYGGGTAYNSQDGGFYDSQGGGSYGGSPDYEEAPAYEY